MNFTKQQKAIIKKIASGEIRDIPSYIRVFNLSKFYKFNIDDIKNRMEMDENGKTYKKLKDGFNRICNTSSKCDSLGIPIPSFQLVPPKEDDFEEVLAIISYNGSSQTVDIDETSKFEYNFFDGINITNSFSDIKDFLTIWQFLKSEGLVLEVDKKITKADYEPFFEYKPIYETKYGKILEKKQNEKAERNNNPDTITLNGKVFNKDDVPYMFRHSDPDRIKDYRNYIDYYFEYNKENEIICSQYISKQIYGNSELDLFIKKRFRTNEEINLNKTLIPAYLALVLTLGITIWQNFSNDNSDLIKIQNQLMDIQQTLSDNPSPNLKGIENQLQEILDSLNIRSINEQLEEIQQEIKEYKQTQ